MTKKLTNTPRPKYLPTNDVIFVNVNKRMYKILNLIMYNFVHY